MAGFEEFGLGSRKWVVNGLPRIGSQASVLVTSLAGLWVLGLPFHAGEDVDRQSIAEFVYDTTAGKATFPNQPLMPRGAWGECMCERISCIVVPLVDLVFVHIHIH